MDEDALRLTHTHARTHTRTHTHAGTHTRTHTRAHTHLHINHACTSGGPGKGMHSRLYTRVLNQYGWVNNCTAFQSTFNR